MKYFDNYLKIYTKHVAEYDQIKFDKIVKLILNIKQNNGKIIIAGNGGSASIANHVSVDLTKVCKIRSVTFNESNLITCFANDYGYEQWLKEGIKSYADKKDLVILISSSGKSLNIINAAKYCRSKKIKLITLAGFFGKNLLSKYGNVNLIVNSDNYNHIEMTHHIWLLCCLDKIIKAKI